MSIRLLALAAMLLTASFHFSAVGQEQAGNGQCNCPKCQAARAAAAENAATLAAQPAGMYSSEATGILNSDWLPDSGEWFKPAKKQSAGVQQAGHYGQTDGPYIRNPGPGPGSHGRRPGASSYGSGTFPNGSAYDHGYPGRPFDGGFYGPFGGAHRTPGYPHHHFHREYVGPQGPPTAQVAYPYYTTRGPRDFLMDNPPSIGR